MKTINIFITVLMSINSVFIQQLNGQVIQLPDSSGIKTDGRVITLIDNNDLCVFTDFDIFLETVRNHSYSPAAKKIYDVFVNYAGSGNIIADSVVSDISLTEKWKMVKGVVISSGKILILNKEKGTLEKQFFRENDNNMCTTLKTEDKTIIWYCLGQN